MSQMLRIALNPTPDQFERLAALQREFARVCNALAPTVRDTRCWNRVALHHMMYKPLREQFPALGSQMVCNAIYSVCRSSRLVYQHPTSVFNVARWGDRPLPLMRYHDTCPVYFDRHTLSIKSGRLSMYTLDGRMRFHLALRPEDEAAFHSMKLREVVLTHVEPSNYELSFLLGDSDESPVSEEQEMGSSDIPEYLMVDEVE